MKNPRGRTTNIKVERAWKLVSNAYPDVSKSEFMQWVRANVEFVKQARSTEIALHFPKKNTKRKSNPGAVLIYEQITRIEGTKGKDSSYAGQKFFHNFKKPYPIMLGLPDGSLLIKSKR
jgi:hypothetical protein